MKWNVRARSRADATKTDGEQNKKREKSAPDAAGWLAEWMDGWLVPALIVLPFVLSFSNRHMPFLLFISLLYFRNFILFSEEKSMGRIVVDEAAEHFAIRSWTRKSWWDASQGAISHKMYNIWMHFQTKF